jgi:hypothetical protein
MNYTELQLKVLLSCIIFIGFSYLLYHMFTRLYINEKFLSKRELRQNVYAFYDDTDPDEHLNNDNMLLKYLDK